jgi:hypothetical protein
MLSRSDFLSLPKDDVVQILRDVKRPHLGVFVPDGSRRLVLAYTDLEPNSDEFYKASAILPAEFVLQSLQVFFDYKLPVLFVPILGRSILKRGDKYQALTLLEGLRVLFQAESTLAYYHQNKIQVRVYGCLDVLQATACQPALDWIAEACQQTAQYRQHKLFYAIGESSIVGEESAQFAAQFALQHGKAPTTDEQIQSYYGESLQPADFFIMTSKMSGMGALPNLLVNGDTEIYYLPTMMGLTERNYRLILYDMLYNRSALREGISEFNTQPDSRVALKQAYERSKDKVIGLGFDVGKVWVLDDVVSVDGD